MICVLFLCWISTRNAFSQSVAWSVGTSVPRFNEDLRLDCTVDSFCCTSHNRIWETGTGTQILNNGTSFNSDKYVEEWNGATSGFSLIIKNLQTTDVGVDYNCRYRIGNDKHTLSQTPTWEYVPTTTCPENLMKIGSSKLKGEIHVDRSAPTPTFFASLGGENVTAYLVESGLSNFESWFYSLTVSIDGPATCKNDERFTLSVVTGTKTKKICDSQNVCKCWDCAGICLGISLILPLICLLFLIIILFKTQTLSCEGCFVITKSAVAMCIGPVFLTAIFNIFPTFLIGTQECPCRENLIWILNILWAMLTGLISNFIICYAYFDLSYLSEQPKKIKLFIFLVAFMTCGTFLLWIVMKNEKPVQDDNISCTKKWVQRILLIVLIILILPIPVLVCFYLKKGENSQSVDSGSSCWPICRVGQDPNTSSSDPEKVRRSSKKESADKKPTGLVRPQPSRAQHLGTDNTGRAEYSAENEMYSEKLLKSNKPRLLPSIGQQTDSPRPLPQMPASAQQGGNQLAPLEKKKKKRKKKREAKQSDEENSTEL